MMELILIELVLKLVRLYGTNNNKNEIFFVDGAEKESLLSIMR